VALPVLIALVLQCVSELVALLMDGRDHQTHRNSDIDKQGFGKLQARLDRLRHRIGDLEIIKPSGVRCVTGTRDDREIRPFRAGSRTTDSIAAGASRVTTSARAVAMPQRRSNST